MADSSSLQFNWPLFGNEHVRSYFEMALKHDGLGHCYVFSGPVGIGKKTYAQAVAHMAFCRVRAGGKGVVPCGACPACRQARAGTHPDIMTVRVSEHKKRIGVEAVRALITHLETGTFGSPVKVGIIESVELLTAEAANALLKTLEEPAARRLIIMTATHHERVPATVLSRSQLIRFRAVPREAVYDYLVHKRGAARDFAKRAADVSFGRPAWVVRWSEDSQHMKAWLEQLEAFRACADAPLHQRLGYVAHVAKTSETPQQAITAWQVVLRERMLAAIGVGDAESDAFAPPSGDARALATAAMQAQNAPRYLRANVSLQSVLEHLVLQLP